MSRYWSKTSENVTKQQGGQGGMIDEARICVAVAADAMVNRRIPMSVFGFRLGGFHQMNVTFRGNFITIFDYGQNNYLFGISQVCLLILRHPP